MTQPEPAPQESPQVQAVRQRTDRLSVLAGLTVAGWSAEQVVEWIGLTDLPAKNAAIVRDSFESLEIEGEDLVELKHRMLQKQLRRSGAVNAEALAREVLDMRDSLVQMPDSCATESDPVQDNDDDHTLNVLVIKERAANDKLMQNRAAALKARGEGFPIPVRRVGDIECGSLDIQLHQSVPAEGALGRSGEKPFKAPIWDVQENRPICQSSDCNMKIRNLD
eukprot:COSAG06_NODE_36_length_30622_cov_18.404869_24_plen_222_part_00